ncbi:MAG TPA: periplasmic heavy metal sensor [Thermoanaerobaculia bacterium]|nr:periplasmic heavy metal sensor [Thermoanaerobaculia bacterium]
MKKTTLTIAGAVALVALLAAPFLFAQGFGHHRGAMGMGMGPLGHLQKIQQKLNLSDQQVSEIKQIVGDLRTQNAPYREQLHGGIQSIVTTLINNPNDTAAAQTILNQQEQAEAAMKANTLAAVSKALNILTPDQRAQLGQMIQQWQAKRASKRGA